MIKAVIFDMGGVVLPLSIEQCIKNFKELAGFEDIEEFLDPFHQKGFFGDLEGGVIGADEFIAKCLEHCRPGTSRQTIDFCFNSIVKEISDDAIKLILELKKNYKIYVLSNNNPIVMNNFDKEMLARGLKTEDLFDGCFFSYKLKVSKPDPEIFKIAIKGAGVNPEEILFIDDSKRNTEVAQSLGINTLLYDVNKNIYDEALNTLNSL